MTLTTEASPLVTPTARLLVSAEDAPPDSAAWHAARAGGVGSSDAAAVLGLDPWNSPLSLWLAKTGRAEPVIESEPMKWGKVLEGPIAEEFGVRSGYRVLPAPGVLVHRDHDWFRANPDRMLAAPDDDRPFSLVEVKNVSAWKAGEWDAEAGLMPMHYLVQVMHQLGVTGYDEASVAALVGGQVFETMTVQRDEALIGMLLEREAAFWDLVLSGTEPAWDAAAPSVEAVRRYRAEPGRTYDLADEDDDLVAAIREVKARKSALAKELKAVEAQERAAVGALQARMGPAEVAVRDGEVVCTWKQSERKGYSVEPAVLRTFRLV